MLRYCIQVRKTFKQSKSEGEKQQQKTTHFVKNTCIRHPANIQKYNNKQSSGLWQAEALYIQLMFKSITRWTNISLLWFWSTLQLSMSTLKKLYTEEYTQIHKQARLTSVFKNKSILQQQVTSHFKNESSSIKKFVLVFFASSVHLMCTAKS